MSEQTKNVSEWQCFGCEGEPKFEYDAFIEHLKTVHHAPEKPAGHKRMLNHMDGRDWFGGTDEFTFDFGHGEFKAHYYYKQRRSPESMAYWGD